MPSALIQVQYCYDYVTNQIPLGLILYTHGPTALLALLFSGYVLAKVRSRASWALGVVCVAFAVWCGLDLISWFVFLGSSPVMVAWSLLDLVALVFSLGAYGFLHAFVTDKPLPAWQQIAGVFLIAPTLLWTFLGLTLSAYDANTCEALEREPFTLYPYAVQGLVLLAVLVLAIRAFRRANGRAKKAEVALASAGVGLFLGFFLLSTLAVNLLVNDTAVQFAYNFEIYGLFGMPVLLGFLGYLIVRYHAFDLKVFGAQALVATIIVLIASEFAFVAPLTNRILVGVTLVLTTAAGALLMRSVAREIRQRERIEGLAKDLEASNAQLSEFMSLATHEIRNPATFIKGAAANILEGDLGAVTPAVRDMVQKMSIRAGDILHLGGQYLDKSKLELGQLTYAFTQVDLAKLVNDLVREFQPAAEQRGLALRADIDTAQVWAITADEGKLKEVIGNLIDNALKYTPKGSVTLTLEAGQGTVTVRVADTGAGITAETLPHLFQKFSRADAAKLNLLGTGLGLYLAGVFVAAHGGRIWAQSAGTNQGSTFFVELPVEHRGSEDGVGPPDVCSARVDRHAAR